MLFYYIDGNTDTLVVRDNREGKNEKKEFKVGRYTLFELQQEYGNIAARIKNFVRLYRLNSMRFKKTEVTSK